MMKRKKEQCWKMEHFLSARNPARNPHFDNPTRVCMLASLSIPRDRKKRDRKSVESSVDDDENIFTELVERTVEMHKYSCTA